MSTSFPVRSRRQSRCGYYCATVSASRLIACSILIGLSTVSYWTVMSAWITRRMMSSLDQTGSANRMLDVTESHPNAGSSYSSNESMNQSTPVVFDVSGNDTYVTMCWEGYDGRRLGNQLFNLAAMLYVARSTNRLVAMPTNNVRVNDIDWRWAIDRWFDLDPQAPLARWNDNRTLFINISHRPHRSIESRLCRTSAPCRTLRERSPLTFDVTLRSQLRQPEFRSAKTLILCGFFQSWKYDVAFVRRILRWKPEITDSVRRFIDDVTSWNSISASVRLVGVHVRCGDVRTRSAVAFGNTIPGRDYFRRAFSYVTGNGVKTGRSGTHHVFVVTSDDVGWTKANLDLERLAEAAMKVAGDPHHVRFRLVYSEGHTAGFDMALLVACDAIILSTGTFGWWSAFLAGNRSSQPTVVYYSRWPRRGSPLDVMLRRRDYWPSQWTAIDGLPYFFV